jgi:hypothetical protein
LGEKADPSKGKRCRRKLHRTAPGIAHFVAVDEKTVVQLKNIGPRIIT